MNKFGLNINYNSLKLISRFGASAEFIISRLGPSLDDGN